MFQKYIGRILMLFVVSSPVYSLTAHSYQLSLQLGFLCSCISVRIPHSDNTQHIEQKSLRSTQNGLFNPCIPASTAHSAQSTNSNLYKPPIMPTNNQDAEPLAHIRMCFKPFSLHLHHFPCVPHLIWAVLHTRTVAVVVYHLKL